MKKVKRAESGFTIIEVLVAATVFMIGMSLLISLLNTTLTRLGTEDLEIASTLAGSDMLRAIATNDTTSADTVLHCSGKQFRMVRTSEVKDRTLRISVAIGRYKQTKVLVNLYDEKALQTP